MTIESVLADHAILLANTNGLEKRDLGTFRGFLRRPYDSLIQLGPAAVNPAWTKPKHKDLCPHCKEGSLEIVEDWREQDPAFRGLQCPLCDSTYAYPHGEKLGFEDYEKEYGNALNEDWADKAIEESGTTKDES